MLPAARVDPAARVVAEDPVVPVVLAARAVAVAVVTITEAVVDRAVPVVRVAPEAPVAPVVRVVLAAAVGSAPVGAETLPVRSASRAVGLPEVESPSVPSVKSSTTWKPRRLAAFGCPGGRVRRFASRAVRH